MSAVAGNCRRIRPKWLISHAKPSPSAEHPGPHTLFWRCRVGSAAPALPAALSRQAAQAASGRAFNWLGDCHAFVAPIRPIADAHLLAPAPDDWNETAAPVQLGHLPLLLPSGALHDAEDRLKLPHVFFFGLRYQGSTACLPHGGTADCGEPPPEGITESQGKKKSEIIR